MCPNQFNSSPFLEIEIIGIPVDCHKEKSKIIGRNSVNPVWNHSVTFKIRFVELAFLRIAVCDGAANGKCITQRVVPVKCLRPGYRHLPLRTTANQPLEQSTLFLRTRFEQEEHIYLHDEDINLYSNYEPELNYQILKIDKEAEVKPLSILRRQIFIIRISGVISEDTPVIVHAESGSTVRSVVQTVSTFTIYSLLLHYFQALNNAGKSNENADDYILFEENVVTIAPSPNAESVGEQFTYEPPTQKVLPHSEPIMDAVACWNGVARRFHLRKKSSDPAGRAWINTFINKGSTNPSISTSTSPSFQQTRKTASSASNINSDNPPSTSTPFIISTAKGPKTQLSFQPHGRSLDVEALPSPDLLDPKGMLIFSL